MDVKNEGAAFPPVPIAEDVVREARKGPLVARDISDVPCEICGAAVVAYHCKRICLRCGFMTGCSEGI